MSEEQLKTMQENLKAIDKKMDELISEFEVSVIKSCGTTLHKHLSFCKLRSGFNEERASLVSTYKFEGMKNES